MHVYRYIEREWFLRPFKTLASLSKSGAPSVFILYIGDLNEAILSVIQIDQHTVKPARLNHAFEIKGKRSKFSCRDTGIP